MVNKRKCAVIGCGFVGATSAYALMKSKLFSERVLVDVDKKKATGEAHDLSHGLSFNSPMEIYAGDYEDLSDCSIIVIAAGAGQKEGETRLDLLEKNVHIFDSIIKSICRFTTEAILLVVTNPVDVLTQVTLKLSGYPKERVIGSGTVLDTARLKYLLGKRFEVDARNVHAFIIGEHGDSELPVFSSANISGIDLVDYCDAGRKNQELCSLKSLEPVFEEVKTSAYRIIEGKGATYYAIAEAVVRIVSAIVRDEKTILPVSTYVEDYYGVHDVCISVPCIVGKNGVENVLKIPLDESEQEKFNRSASIIRSAFDSIKVFH
ncbi:MAG: L-lactate dehydrogenase [Clostridia bacterium]|nr:L-lactate dehydrogenase [Clostridia bacterium]